MNLDGRKLTQVWFFYFILAVALFVLQESVFRFVFPLPEISNFNRVNYSMMMRSDPNEKIQPLSNAAFTWASAPDGAEFIHHLNLYGFRDSDWPVKDGMRVMFIGDSFVEGFMAADDETIPGGFERASAVYEDPIEAMNLGTGASGVDEYMAVIGDAVPLFRPQTVILVLYANDFGPNKVSEDSLDTATAAIRINPYLPRLYQVMSKLVKGDSIATRWSKKPFLFLPTSASARSPLHDDDFVEHVRNFVSPRILESMKRGHFNPFVINEYTNYKAFLSRTADMSNVIEHTRNFVKAHGSKLMVVHVPYKGQVSDYYLEYVKQYDENKRPTSLMMDEYQRHAESLRVACEQFDVPFLDVTATLRQHEADGQRMYWNYDEHMKASSYLIIGEEIHKFWRNTDSQAAGN